jgi:hypothetical protein
MINAIRKAAPGAAIAFNTRPDDSVSLGAIDFGMIVDGSVVVNAATPVAEMHDRRPHLWHRASQQDRVRDLAPGREYGSPCAGRMIQAESPLGHHLFKVPIAERIAQIPTKAHDDDLVLKVSPAKQCRPACSSLVYPTRPYSTRLRQILWKRAI